MYVIEFEVRENNTAKEGNNFLARREDKRVSGELLLYPGVGVRVPEHKNSNLAYNS